jgi:hypothetical protein
MARNSTVILTEAQFEGARTTAAWADVLDRANDGFRDMAPAAGVAAVAADQTRSQLTILQAALAGPLRQALEDQRTKTEEIAGKQAELNGQIAEATRLYGESSPKVFDLKSQYADLNVQLAGVNRQYNESVESLAFAAAQSALFSDGVQEGEVPALMAMGEQLGLVDEGTATLYKKFDDLYNLNKDKGAPGWEDMNKLLWKVTSELTTGTTPAVNKHTSAQTLLIDAAKKADEQLGFVFNDLNGIKGVADSAAKAVGALNGNLNSIPQHVGPYAPGGSYAGGTAAPGAPPPRFDEGGLASGPLSGYPAELHGTEAVVPLPDGKSIPVQIAGGGGEIRLVLSIPVILDGHEIGRASFDGTLAEARARGLALGA